MEPLLPLLRQFCQPTTNNSHTSTGSNQSSRGNIAVLSLIWFAFTALGCAAIVRSTQTVLLRGHGQGIADAVALAHADNGAQSASYLAQKLNVDIESVSREANGIITIVVRGHNFTATSSAS